MAKGLASPLTITIRRANCSLKKASSDNFNSSAIFFSVTTFLGAFSPLGSSLAAAFAIIAGIVFTI